MSAFGYPCWGSLDRPTLRAVQVPALGGHLGLEFRGVNTSQQAWLVFGASNTTWNGQSLPLSLDDLGLEGCQLYVSADLNIPFYAVNGTRSMRLPVPTDMALVGQSGFLQVFFPDFAANAVGMGSTNAVEFTIGGPQRVDIPALSSEVVDIAIQASFVSFDETLSGGAHTHVFNAGEFGKAAAAYNGDTRVDQKLLEQIRFLLIPGNGITATGGFQDQKQVGSTAMFALARRTPRIWDQLTTAEKDKISIMMYGALLSSSFVSSDHNPFVKSGGDQYGLNGIDNLNRDWNPNFRNGFLGQVIVCSLYFGLERAQQELRQHDHAAWVASLPSAGLLNMHRTYTSSSPDRPTAAQVDVTVHQDYSYYGIPLSDPMAIYLNLTANTFALSVTSGLGGGAGKLGSNGVKGGYTDRNSNSLPNRGKIGMLREFDTIDASGTRSSAQYSNDGWYVNNYIHYVLLAYGGWEDTSESEEILDRILIGTDDLRFKIDPSRGGGYHNLQHGRGFSSTYRMSLEFGHPVNFAIADALQAFHGR